MRKWIPLTAICLGTFMLLVDVTIVNVALPSMAADLHTSFSSLQWVIDAYALALAALLMGVGAIADVSGHRRNYSTGLIVFAIASIACGIAPNPGVLVTARAVQGAGAAAMFATTFSLVNSSYHGRDRGIAYGIYGAVSGAAAALGPILGGLLTQGFSWRSIFFVNVPVSVAALLLTRSALPIDPRASRRRVDIPGILVFTLTCGATTFAMIQAGEHGWTSPTVLTLLTVAATGLITFILIERRNDHALVDLALFRQRTFVGILIASLVLYFSAFGYLTYISIWMQTLLGLTPIEAGLASLPLSVASFTASLAIGRFAHHAPAGRIISIGVVLAGAGALLSALLLTTYSSWPALVPGLLVTGIGVGLATPILSATASAAVGSTRGGMAAGAVNTATQLGFAFGIALLGTVFTSGTTTALQTAGITHFQSIATRLAGGQAQTLIKETGHELSFIAAAHTAFAAGLEGALAIAGIAGLLAGIAVLFLIPKKEPAPV